jgi:hypothetical protein
MLFKDKGNIVTESVKIWEDFAVSYLKALSLTFLYDTEKNMGRPGNQTTI